LPLESGPETVLVSGEKKKGNCAVWLDLVEEGSDEVVWALVVGFWQCLGDPVFVSGGDIHHVVAGCYDLGLVGRVLDVVLDVFKLCF